ncbi:MAG TPA: hypothetical protein VEQ11_10170 [Chloroflexota bacterium]|nr:hypothetical protein [Chloroflexota bacterium]
MSGSAADRERVQLGQSAPEFILDSIDGRRLGLLDFRGRALVLWLSRGVY